MIRLVGVEVSRLLARRMFRYLMLIFFLVLVFIIGLIGAKSNRDVAAAHARALALAQQQEADFSAHQAFLKCPVPNGCQIPPVDVLAQQMYQDPRFNFATTAPDVLVSIVAAVALLGFVFGAAFIGAEWAAGTMASLLTWEPRRLRVLAAKLVAALVVMIVVGVIAGVFALAAFWVVAATRGTTAGTTGHVIGLVLSRGLRGLLLIALLTAAGAAIAGFSRHTPAALVGGVAYLIAFELVLRHFRPGWERWFLTDNSAAVLTGKTNIFLPSPPGGFNDFTRPQVFVLHGGRATLYLSALMLVLVATWVVTFLRRDIDEGGGR